MAFGPGCLTAEVPCDYDLEELAAELPEAELYLVWVEAEQGPDLVREPEGSHGLVLGSCDPDTPLAVGRTYRGAARAIEAALTTSEPECTEWKRFVVPDTIGASGESVRFLVTTPADRPEWSREDAFKSRFVDVASTTQPGLTECRLAMEVPKWLQLDP